MKYFGQKNVLAKHLANATFFPEPKVALYIRQGPSVILFQFYNTAF